MSYNTEHVRNVGDTPGTIAGVPTYTELLNNTNLAAIYTAVREASTATAPEIKESVAVSKKTVYAYLRRLEQAGLVSRIEDKAGPSVYEAEDFELTITVREMEVSITPELVEVVAYANEYPVISRVIEENGVVTFALAHDLVKAHAEGDITIRQIASLTGLSSGTTYDLLDAISRIHDLGDDDPTPTTYTPEDIRDEDTNLIEELTE